MSASDDSDQCNFSDDEEVFQADSVTWKMAKKYKLIFGKHKGRQLSSLTRNKADRNYLRYLLEWEDLREEPRAHIACALEHYAQKKESRR